MNIKMKTKRKENLIAFPSIEYAIRHNIKPAAAPCTPGQDKNNNNRGTLFPAGPSGPRLNPSQR